MMAGDGVSLNIRSAISKGRTPLLALGAAFLLSHCASPETRLRAGLVEAGLPSAQAACMAQRMADRLSLLQLKRLASLSGLKEKELGAMTQAQFLHHVRALNDGEILTVSLSGAAVCFLK
jgi:hypothetical protein